MAIVEAQVLTFADLELDTGAQAILRNGRRVNLTAMEFRILQMFMLNPGRILSRQDIHRGLYGKDAPDNSNIVEVYVRYLRQKIGEPRLIQTRRLRGYILEELA